MSPIHVTRPLLPPLQELLPHLQEIWDRRILANAGPFHQRFEARLTEYLGVDHLSLCSNATVGLMMALRDMGGEGEVVTTPFSFAATAHAIAWAGFTPVFADVEPESLNLDPEAVERALTPRTRAILAVHCYGHVCDVERLGEIARSRGLKLIYDAAHAFGVCWRERSVLRHGDLSVLSFHATKVFNTFEGGAIVAADPATKQRMDRLRNFGIVDEHAIEGLGLNGKMNEFCAALGLVQLDHVEQAIDERRQIDQRYRRELSEVPGLRCLGWRDGETPNFAYFPILVDPAYGITRDALQTRLREHDIHARRYFSPLLSDLPAYRHLPSASPSNLPVAAGAASRVLCLPLFPGLRVDDQDRIVELIRDAGG